MILNVGLDYEYRSKIMKKFSHLYKKYKIFQQYCYENQLIIFIIHEYFILKMLKDNFLHLHVYLLEFLILKSS